MLRVARRQSEAKKFWALMIARELLSGCPAGASDFMHTIIDCGIPCSGRIANTLRIIQSINQARSLKPDGVRSVNVTRRAIGSLQFARSRLHQRNQGDDRGTNWRISNLLVDPPKAQRPRTLVRKSLLIGNLLIVGPSRRILISLVCSLG